MQSCIWMTEAERNHFFKYGREKRRFCLEAFGKNVLVNLAMSKIVAVYEEGQIECGTFCVNEKWPK